MEDRHLGAGAGRHVCELERDVAAASEEHTRGHAIQVQEAIAGDEPLGTREAQGPRHGAGADDEMAARQAVVADGERGRPYEPGQPMEPFHPHLRPALVGAGGGPPDHGALEAHELGPVDRERPGWNTLALQVLRSLDGVRRTDQDLLRHAAAERTGATERLPIDDGDAPAGLTALRDHLRGNASPDDDEIVLPLHDGLPSQRRPSSARRARHQLRTSLRCSCSWVQADPGNPSTRGYAWEGSRNAPAGRRRIRSMSSARALAMRRRSSASPYRRVRATVRALNRSAKAMLVN